MNSIKKLRIVLSAYAPPIVPSVAIPGKNTIQEGGFTCYMFAWFVGPGYNQIYLQTTVQTGPDGLPVNISVPVHSYDADGNDVINYPTAPPNIIGVPSSGKWRLVRLGSNAPIDTIVGEPGQEFVVPPQATPPACPPPPTQLSPEEVQYPTEADIINATLCGEASTEGLEGQSLVWAIAENRSKVRRSPIKVTLPTGVPNTPIVREFLKLNAFSCWNNTYPSRNQSIRDRAGSNPRSGISNFNQRLRYLASLCGTGRAHEDASPEQGRTALVRAGMTEAEAKRAFLYLNPKSAKSNDFWAVDTIASANRNPGVTKWVDEIRDSRGKKQKTTLVRIGRHVFISSPGLNP